jgi:hypothetical protein
MRLLATHFLQFLTWLVLDASSHVEGYYIAPACAKYGVPPKDLRPVIRSAMLEAHSMAESSIDSGLQVGNDDPMDNSKLLLFPRAEARHYEEVIGTYVTGVEQP